MKKQWIALLTGCVLVCSMLAGCGSKPQTSAPAAAGSDKGCSSYWMALTTHFLWKLPS